MRLADLTVTVPTRNETANIGPFLASLDPRVRLIVADASTDDTPDRILAARPDNTRILRDAGTIPVARQRALEAAETEWVLCTDVDMSFGPGYWAAWQDLALSARVGAVQGAKLSADEHFRTYYRLFSFGIRAAAWLTVPAGTGSNMIVRRSALLAAGGFDAALTANEDIYALWTVRKAGWRVPFAGGLKVYERDHRRLEGGRARKTLHGWVRPLMLMTGIGGDRVRGSSWGYWNDADAPSDGGEAPGEAR